LNRNNAVEDWK